jgi:hypothetical protein
MSDRAFTPPQLAKRWAVSPDRIRAMIRSGRLAAFNLAEPGDRAQFRISVEAVETFEKGRQIRPPAKPHRPRQRIGPVRSFV